MSVSSVIFSFCFRYIDSYHTVLVSQHFNAAVLFSSTHHPKHSLVFLRDNCQSLNLVVSNSIYRRLNSTVFNSTCCKESQIFGTNLNIDH